MKPENCLIFGASGQIGRNLIRGLAQKNFKITAVTRNLHQKGYILKTQANPGYLDLVEANIFDLNKLEKLIKKADVCINLVGILYEKGKNNFQNIHVKFPEILSNLCAKNKVKKFIHVSALGIEEATNSTYAISKLSGEKAILKNFENAVILRPSIVYSSQDNFSTMLMSLLNIIPIFPLYYSGKTKFMPLHCSELCKIITTVIEKNTNEKIIECIGPEELSFKEILEKLLKLIEKKNSNAYTNYICKYYCIFFQILPKPLITRDQIRLLNFDNIPSGKYKTNFDINLKTELKFESEVEKYFYMWKESGEYSKKNNLN